MILDLDRTIRQLLVEELPIKNGEIDVQFDQPTREWSARLTRPTVNFFLYDVRENHILRQHQWEPGVGPGIPNHVTQKRSPYRVDCHYMMTAWASEAQDEHRLLSRSMLALWRNPVLPSEGLVGEMRNQPFKVQARLAAHDKMPNPAELWSALDNELRPSLSYVVTIALDPWAPVTGPAVRTLTLRTGQAVAPAATPGVITVPSSSLTIFGGTVSRDGQPARGAQVALKGTGWVSTTDEQGHYRFSGVAHGDYTLLVWPPPDDNGTARPIEREISVPDGDYNVSL